MAGLRVYIANKPDDRDWLHPSTFLNQGRWMDEYESVRREVGADGRVPTPAEAKQWLAEHPSQRECNFVPTDWRPRLRAVE